MRSTMSKPLHEVGGRPLIAWCADHARAVGLERLVVVTGPSGDDVAVAAGPDAVRAIQDPPRGTGDAAAQAMPALAGFEGVVLILCGDTPLLQTDTLQSLADAAGTPEAGLAVLGFEPDDPGAYGRLRLTPDGDLDAIVEHADATDAERAIRLCNAGVMAVEAALLRTLLPELRPDNAKGELYLTDLVALARKAGRRPKTARCAPEEALGVNTRMDLAAAEAAFQNRARHQAMALGVTLQAPETVFFSHDTQLAADVTVEPFVVFGPGVTIETGARIKAHSSLEGAHVGPQAEVGPFARLRPGAEIGEAARIGNFVEVKKTRVHPGAKANHLAYLGDAEIGPDANVGAGVVTCNYDGVHKHRTEIGARAFVGTNSSLVAPIRVGDDAFVGAGSVATRDVENGAFAIARARQKTIPGGAAKIRGAPKKRS